MCGIFGAISTPPQNNKKLINATDLLHHRGPNGKGYYSSEDGKVFLGHRRLSIIDLSESANQPMASSDGRYIIAYNGEVYNFIELKKRLPGFLWKTNGDTEVILELFARFGADSFSWLNGIFAFSIYDTFEQRLWLCRDHLGIKPLFISRSQEHLFWGSELKTVTSLYDKDSLQINEESIPYFLHLGYIPEPMTIYRGVEKFPAGHFAQYDLKTGKWEQASYWQAADHYLKQHDIDEENALRTFRDKLYAAVERQMVSDVPLGTFLSGGIDSSLVTAVASQVHKGKVKSFSIGFTDTAFDESEYATQVANHLQSEHHLFKVTQDDILELIPEFISVYDEPFADSSAFPTMLVSRLAREHVTVTLSGDGGDELFQGYGMYQWAARLHQPMVELWRKPLYQLSKLLPLKYQRAGRLFDYPDRAQVPSHIFSQEQYLFSQQELQDLLLKPAFDFAPFNKLPSSGLPQEQQAFWDLEHYLKDDLLVKVDRASMRYSLETRVPLLDRDLVEFALSLPMHLKVREGYGTKYLMKRVLYELVPRSIFERPKRGFSIPLNRWLLTDLKPLVDKYLNEDVVRAAGWVQPEYVARLLRAYRGGKTYLYNRVWVLLVLHWWREHNS